MELKWNIESVPMPPCVVSHYMHGSVARMVQNVRENGCINVSVRHRTKTTLDINVWYDEDCFAVAHIPQGAEHLKFVEASQYSFFDSASETRYYLRLSKRQGLGALKEYLSLVLAQMGLNMDTLTVNMRIIGVEELKAA